MYYIFNIFLSCITKPIESKCMSDKEWQAEINAPVNGIAEVIFSMHTPGSARLSITRSIDSINYLQA